MKVMSKTLSLDNIDPYVMPFLYVSNFLGQFAVEVLHDDTLTKAQSERIIALHISYCKRIAKAAGVQINDNDNQEG